MNPVDELYVLGPAFCWRLTQTLLHFLWQGLAIALAVAAASWWLRRASANVRYAVHVSALLLMAACLPATFALVPAGRPVPRGEYGAANAALASVQPPDRLADALAAESPAGWARSMPRGADQTIAEPVGPMSASAAVFAALERVAPYTAAVYLFGVAIMLCRSTLALWGAHRLRLGSTPVSDQKLLAMLQRQAQQIRTKTVPAIAFCHRIAVPVVVGIVKPVILLPASFVAGLSADQLQALLAHELAHIRRYDPLVNLLQRLVESLLFFHPAVWYLHFTT